MDCSGFKKFNILLWKNFTLKRRRCIALVVEITLMTLFSIALLATRKVLVIKKRGPFDYPALPVNNVPTFISLPVTSPYPWELAYVPSKSTVVWNIIDNVKKDLNINMKVVGFSSESDFEDYVKQKDNSDKVLAAVVFDHYFKNSNDPLPLQVKYYLRFSHVKKSHIFGHLLEEKTWFTHSLFPSVPTVGPRNPHDSDGGSPGYISEGFVAVQHAVDKAIMRYHNSTAAQALLKDVHIFIQRFPHASYYHDYFFLFSGIFIPLLILCIFSLNHLTLVQSIVWEKEKKLKEYQLMIGLSNWMLWAAYFFTFLCLYSVTIIVLCIILFVKIEPAPVLQYSDPTLVFAFLLLYAIATIFFSFMTSTFFSKTNFAVAWGGLLFFVIYFPASSLFMHYAQMTFIRKLVFCLSSNYAMALGVKFLVEAEKGKIGIKWSNIVSSHNLDNFLFVYVLGMFVFDAFLYGLVTWYVEAVFPGKYGVPKPWNFFLQRSYWFGGPPEKELKTKQFYETIENQYFEAEPTDLVAGIQIKHLCKVFRGKKTTKLQNFCYVFCLILGLYPYTSGNAYINGYDISKEMTEIRKSLGLCPQQDLLFNYLTVSEHLYFYCVVKGIPGNMCPTETDRMLSAFNLLDKRDAFSVSLSGGMKRKLSIIIALIGGSKVVILDEPTSGMDPASRRATWDLLQQYKENRTILLTTHYMDEADILGDRIAIMVRGSLRCCGSSVFLKKIYGVGYHIVMVKEPQCDVEEVSKLICYHIPTATLENNVGTELSFILPKEYSHRFEDLFTILEKRQKELGIASFGASITTMEEVFLRVSHMEDLETDNQAMQPSSQSSRISTTSQSMNVTRNVEEVAPSLNEDPTIKNNTGCFLYNQQFCAMFKKRVIFSWRNWNLVLLQILGLLGCLVFLLQTGYSSQNDEQVRQMDLHQYGQTIVPFSISGDPHSTADLLNHLERRLKLENQKLKKVEGDLLKYLKENKECIFLCIIALSVEVKPDQIILTILFNNEAYHSPSVSLALLDNILFMSLSGDDASLTIYNKPFPPPTDGKKNERIVLGHQLALNLQFGIALLISGFCLLTVTERTTKAKHIQFLSGVSIFVFWFSALLWDFIIFFIACCLILVVLKCYKFDIYIMDYHILETMSILTLYGWCAIPFAYLMSFLFSTSTSAYIKILLFNYMTGSFGLILDNTLQNKKQTSLSNATRTFLRNSLLVFPNYNLAKCISSYTNIYHMKILCSYLQTPVFLNCSKENTEKNIYSLEESMIGKYLIAMSIIGFLSLLLIFFCETTLWRVKTFLNQRVFFGIYKRCRKNVLSKELSGQSEDEDVQNERQRILGQPQELLNSTVLIKELTKIYFQCPAILAVKNISLAIQKGECFGLLGFNGAGKTSTFQILTGEESATSGEVIIDGYSITKHIQKVRSRIGYCPQFDALLEYMTAQEIMIMYARIWGVSEPQIEPYVTKFFKSLELESHADKLISTFSGGNKRRLSTAIALMGKSSVIFLDEPSTGMDPVARRLLWNILTQTRKSGKLIIITSHSMEECDALCTRLAIMVQGKFMCLGSPQHLKNKFGNIYIMKAKVKSMDKLEDFKIFITTRFPGSILKQENQGILTYYIPSQDNGWGKVFGILEKAKEIFDLEDYSISQITLEQVFLTFANQDKTADNYEEKVP
ncbi:ATP-binding cassette sub-family A member 3-like [Tupaia chinensis]|uniref:ATP-binding cassette sub-family A member 3-like n=1 Tax=Tupaia chinensis TaxID=246437 RepID=UPI0003C922BA|nr:ATP-binding cassette sub-family A member 3-like [Tupaia chinensis]